MLRFVRITKGYGNKKALHDVSINFDNGKVYALVGPNGSGKSTLMKVAAGLVKPTQGECFFDDMKICAQTNAKIAYMSTEPFYYDYMKIKDVGIYYKDFYEDFSEEKYNNLIRFMELDMNMKVKALSSGMAAKLKIAASLSREAKVIMLDEPLNGIDLIGRDQIINAVIRAASERDATIIISSHLFEELEPIVDNVVMVHNGKIILDGNIEEIRIKTGKSISDMYREIYSGNNDILNQLNNFGGDNNA